MLNYPNATLLDHPIIRHKITHLRDKTTHCGQFREMVKEIAMLEGYETETPSSSDMCRLSPHRAAAGRSCSANTRATSRGTTHASRSGRS